MEPYYTRGGVTLYHGDALDVMRAVGAADSLITDPPFGIEDAPMLDLPGRGGRGNNTWHATSDWDATIAPEWCVEACRVAPVVAWFGHWRMRRTVEDAMPFPIRAEIVWAKDCHVGPPCPVAMRDERIWLFSASGIKGQRFDTSVWDERIIPTWAFKHHKNEKPVALMARLLAFLTVPGALVLDPFMGSGTTGVACIEHGRRFIGGDQDEAHCETAAKRLDAALSQGNLFAA